MEDDYWTPEREKEESRLATPGEAVKEWAYNAGAAYPGDAWLLSDYDTWERNPHYRGPKVPHPEDDDDRDDPGGAPFIADLPF